ncbi:MAG TPA: hypothetical protein VFF18_10385 [Woeseiaceae bacterium]|nr:hypothetical protein [Woeseiaceae bacterium]
MNALRTLLLAAGALSLLAGPAQADDHSPGVTPAEFFPCTFNDGKDMGDLKKVIDRWNDFMDENDDSGYQAWLLTPDFVSGDQAGWHVGWLGGWPSGKAMGASLDVWHSKGGDLQRAFDDVVSCAAHINYAVLPMKEAEGEPPTRPLLSFTDCEVERGAGMEAGLGAVQEWIEWETSAGGDSPHWVFFPGYGSPVDADLDFKWVTGYRDYAAFGRDWDAYGNEGGWQKAQQIFRGTLDCDSPRVYQVQQIRSAERQ